MLALDEELRRAKLGGGRTRGGSEESPGGAAGGDIRAGHGWLPSAPIGRLAFPAHDSVAALHSGV